MLWHHLDRTIDINDAAGSVQEHRHCRPRSDHRGAIGGLGPDKPAEVTTVVSGLTFRVASSRETGIPPGYVHDGPRGVGRTGP